MGKKDPSTGSRGDRPDDLIALRNAGDVLGVARRTAARRVERWRQEGRIEVAGKGAHGTFMLRRADLERCQNEDLGVEAHPGKGATVRLLPNDLQKLRKFIPGLDTTDRKAVVNGILRYVQRLRVHLVQTFDAGVTLEEALLCLAGDESLDDLLEPGLVDELDEANAVLTLVDRWTERQGLRPARRQETSAPGKKVSGPKARPRPSESTSRARVRPPATPEE